MCPCASRRDIPSPGAVPDLLDADGGGDARPDVEALVLQERGLVVVVDHHLHPCHRGQQGDVILLLCPQDKGQPWQAERGKCGTARGEIRTS